jgi:hypothetical protein
MTEVVASPMETMPPHEAIAAVMHGWLAEEIRGSKENKDRKNKNSVLDDWDTFIQNGLAKAKNHYDRLKLRTSQFQAMESYDKFIALQIFDTQMGMSGAFRTQCRVMAVDHQDYLAKRYGNSPLKIDIGKQINKRLDRHFGRMPSAEDLRMARVLPETLISQTHATNQLRLSTIEKISRDEDFDLPLNKVNYSTRLERLQNAWMNLGVDYIVYAAQQRGGDLASVPMMQPKSITDAEIYYPFANS